MMAPHHIIKKYITERLNIVLKDLSNELSPKKSVVNLEWDLSVADGFIYSTSLPYKIAKEINLDPQIISNKIKKNVTDPKMYFSAIYAEAGYISFIIHSTTCESLLVNLQNWLSNTNRGINIAQLKYTTKKNATSSILYRQQLFIKSKKNILTAQGYEVIVRKENDLSSDNYIELYLNNRKYSYNVAPINNNLLWEDIKENLTPFVINYFLLYSDINKNITLPKNLVFNINNPLYLLYYGYKNSNNRTNYFNIKHYNHDILIRKILLYPQKLEICNTSTNFRAIFYYLNELIRLTFDYDLWQNCTEKISIGSIINYIVKHAVNFLLI